MTGYKSASAAFLAGLAVLTLADVAAAGKNYGCFRVTADEINIRARPYSDASVLGTVSKGAVLEKRKMLCTLRGYWCAVRTGTGIEGYADKSFLDKISCP